MNIAIIGAGYFGAKLAEFWTRGDHHVSVATWHPDWAKSLTSVAQKCVFLKESSEAEILSLLVNNETIVLTLAIDAPAEEEMLKIVRLFRKIALENELIRRILFISSTSVYGDHHGLWVDETAELKAHSESGRILIEMERLAQSLQEMGCHVCTLRMAEVYGKDHSLLERFRPLAGQTLSGSKESYSNMIHCEDAVSAVDYAMRHHLQGIYNLSDDEHPTLGHLYDELAKHFRLPPVSWDSSRKGAQLNKRISNHKVKAEGFVLHHSHRVLD